MSGLNKLFLDSADISEAELCIDRSIISGVTTNPSLFSKQPKGDFITHCKKLADVFDLAFEAWESLGRSGQMKLIKRAA